MDSLLASGLSQVHHDLERLAKEDQQISEISTSGVPNTAVVEACEY